MRHGETWWRRLGRGGVRPDADARPARVFRPGADTGLEDRQLMSLQVATFNAPSVPFSTQDITFAQDGNLWFTEPGVGKIGTITPQGAVTEFNLPAGHTSIGGGITPGVDGNLWFTETNTIGRITPTGVVTEFPVETNASLSGITSGSDGNLWFMDTDNFKIGRITPTGTVTEFPIPPAVSETSQAGVILNHDITPGSDGNLWYTAEVYNHQTQTMSGVIGRVTTSGAVTQFKLPPPPPTPKASPFSSGNVKPSGGLLADSITPGPGGDLWFTAHQTNGLAEIGRISTTGKIKMYEIPKLTGADRVPYIATDIATGADGNLWFNLTTDDFLNGPTPVPFVGRITPAGQVHLYEIPAAKTTQAAVLTEGADSITTGPFGNIWFAGSSRQYTSPTGRVVGEWIPPKS